MFGRDPLPNRIKAKVGRAQGKLRLKVKDRAPCCPGAIYLSFSLIHAALGNACCQLLRALSAGHFPQPDPLGSSPHSVFPTGFAKSETVSGSLETYFRATSVFPSQGSLRKCCGLKVYTTPPHPTPSRPAIHLLKSSPSQGDGAKRWGLGDAMKS